MSLTSFIRPTPRRPARSVHERVLPGPRAEIVRLMEGLGGPEDRLWPADRWPAIILDMGCPRAAREATDPSAIG